MAMAMAHGRPRGVPPRPAVAVCGAGCPRPRPRGAEAPSRKDRAAPRSADPRRRSAPPQCTVHRQPTAPHRAPTGTDRRHRPAPTDRHRRRHRAHRVSRFLRCSCETVPTSFIHTRKLCRYVLRLQARPRIAKLRLARARRCLPFGRLAPPSRGGCSSPRCSSSMEFVVRAWREAIAMLRGG